MAKKTRISKETLRICNVIPSRNTETDWPFEAAIQSGAVTVVAAPAASVDLRATWWTIGDQEDTGITRRLTTSTRTS